MRKLFVFALALCLAVLAARGAMAATPKVTASPDPAVAGQPVTITLSLDGLALHPDGVAWEGGLTPDGGSASTSIYHLPTVPDLRTADPTPMSFQVTPPTAGTLDVMAQFVDAAGGHHTPDVSVTVTAPDFGKIVSTNTELVAGTWIGFKLDCSNAVRKAASLSWSASGGTILTETNPNALWAARADFICATDAFGDRALTVTCEVALNGTKKTLSLAVDVAAPKITASPATGTAGQPVAFSCAEGALTLKSAKVGNTALPSTSISGNTVTPDAAGELTAICDVAMRLMSPGTTARTLTVADIPCTVTVAPASGPAQLGEIKVSHSEGNTGYYRFTYDGAGTVSAWRIGTPVTGAAGISTAVVDPKDPGAYVVSVLKPGILKVDCTVTLNGAKHTVSITTNATDRVLYATEDDPSTVARTDGDLTSSTTVSPANGGTVSKGQGTQGEYMRVQTNVESGIQYTDGGAIRNSDGSYTQKHTFKWAGNGTRINWNITPGEGLNISGVNPDNDLYSVIVETSGAGLLTVSCVVRGDGNEETNKASCVVKVTPAGGQGATEGDVPAIDLTARLSGVSGSTVDLKGATVSINGQETDAAVKIHSDGLGASAKILVGNDDGSFTPEDPLASTQFAKMLLTALGYDEWGTHIPTLKEFNLNIEALTATGVKTKLLGNDGQYIVVNEGNTLAPNAQIVNASGAPVEAVGSNEQVRFNLGAVSNMRNLVPANEVEVTRAIAGAFDSRGALLDFKEITDSVKRDFDAHFYVDELKAENFIAKLKTGAVSTAADDDEEYAMAVLMLTRRTSNGAEGVTVASVPVFVVQDEDGGAALGGPHSGCDALAGTGAGWGALGLAALGGAVVALRRRA